MGNRLSRTDTSGGGTVSTAYGYDAANRLTGAGGQAVTSDADGNTLTDGTHTNVWDSQNRLRECDSVEGSTCRFSGTLS